MLQASLSWCALRRLVLCAAVVVGAATAVPPGVAAFAGQPAPLELSTDFPSGSGEVESIDQEARIIRVRPTAHRGRACWWYIKITGITPGETITIDMGGDKWAQPDRAAFSPDGESWQQTGPGEKRDGRIAYRQQVDSREAYFAWGPPFSDQDAANFVQRIADQSPHAAAWTLCRSREGRPVPALRIAQPAANAHDSDRYGIWIQARQHAWESGSSWVARGLVEWLVSDDARAQAMRTKATIVVVPVMDVDNVAIGAGGKYQKPHDHNRDWSDAPHFPEVAAAQQHIKRLDDAGRFDFFLDLHNPAPERRDPYFAIPPPAMYAEPATANLERFLMAARTELTEPLAFRGRTVESGYASDKLWVQKSSVWAVQNTADHVIGLALETPWNTPHSTTDGYRAVGRKVGLALERSFRQPPEGSPSDGFSSSNR